MPNIKHILYSYYFNLTIGIIILCWVTLYNGYPVIYLDSATYIKSGFILETPFDRPITYSLFLMLTSFYKLSLLFTVLIQNLILSWLLLECYIKCLKISKVCFFSIVILILSSFTGLSWVSNQIFADLFTSFIFLSVFLILTYEEQKRKKLYLLFFIFLLSVSSHLSHISITELFLFLSIPLTLWIFSKLNNNRREVVLKRGAILVSLGFLAILTMGSAISKSSSIFFTGKLCENGILKKYLDENCDSKKYKLCKFKNELTYPAVDFVWSSGGATSKLGGWKTTRQEYSEIDNQIIKSPRYLKMLFVESLKSGVQQFALNDIGEGNSHILNDSNVVTTIKRFFGHEAFLFYNSKQSKEQIDYLFFNEFYYNGLIVFLIIFVILFVRKVIYKEYDYILILCSMIIIGITVNNFLSASLANAISRFGLRVTWLMVFACLIMLVQLLNFRKKDVV